MSDNNATARAEMIAALGISMTATFVPQSASRNRNEKAKSLNWAVTLKTPRGEFTTDYMQGIGHVPGYNAVGTNPRLRSSLADKEWRGAQVNASEAGKYPDKRAIGGYVARSLPLPTPSLEDVLFCLVSDSSAAMETFEEWCCNLGYDTDSRRAHATYMACADSGLRLQRLVGGWNELQRLAELFQDY